MRRWWEWLGLNLGKHAGIVSIVGLALTFVLGIGVTQLRFSTSNNDYLNKNDPVAVENTRYENLFGGDPMVLLITMNKGKTVDDLFTPANQQAMNRMDAALAKDPYVFGSISPMSSMGISQALLKSPDGSVLDSPAATLLLSAYQRDTNPASRTARWNYIIANAHAISQFSAADQQLTNPPWVHFITHEATTGKLRASVRPFEPNEQHALDVIFLKPNLDIIQETKAASTVAAITDKVHLQGATFIVTGVPDVLKTINGYLHGGFRKLGLFAAALMVIILAISFTVRWRLLAFFIVAVGLTWGFGLLGYMGVPLTLATITALPVLMGVGMDYAIQMHSRIEEEVVLDRATHPIQAAARGLGPALLVVTFDAVFAFMAMWFAKVPAIRQFGSLLVVGIIAVCVCSIVLTLAILGIREYRSPTKGKDFSKGRLSRLVVWLGSVPSKVAVPAMILAAVVFLGGVAVEGKLVMQTDPIQWLNQKAPAIQRIETLMHSTGSDSQLGFTVTSNQAFSPQMVAFAVQFGREEVAKYGTDVFPPAGLPNIIDSFTDTPGAKDVPPTAGQVEGFYLILPPGIRNTLVADGGKAFNLIFQGRVAQLSSLNPMIQNVARDAHPPPGVQVAPGGIAVVGVGLLQNLAKSRTLLTYLALIFVGAFLAVRLRSLIRSLLSLVPVLVAVGAVSLIGVAFNLKLSPITALSGPLVVAVCTEFTSLILLRFVEERARGFGPREAMDVTASRTGRAFMVSGMTAVGGIAVLATSSMPMLRDFGIIVAMNVAVALLSALIVLPPVLVWADDDKRGWVSRSLLRRRVDRFEPYLTSEEQARVAAGEEVPLFAPEPVLAGVGADSHGGHEQGHTGGFADGDGNGAGEGPMAYGPPPNGGPVAYGPPPNGGPVAYGPPPYGPPPNGGAPPGIGGPTGP